MNFDHHQNEIERAKQAFLAVIKWCSRYAGAKVVFDTEDSCPKADVDNRIIHMPKKIILGKEDSVLGTVIHEAMHIKETPKWLGELCRDEDDHTIFNALEDARIEVIACKTLKALKYFLGETVKEVKDTLKSAQIARIKLGHKILCNIACQASGNSIFQQEDVSLSEIKNKKLLNGLQEIYDRIFSVTMASSFEKNVMELYEKIDEFRRIYDFPPADPSKKEQQQETQYKIGSGNSGKAYGAMDLETLKSSKEPGSNVPALDIEDLKTYLINTNAQAKERIKETLKKTMTVVIDEGRELNTEHLTEIYTGNIDELFIDTKSERKMRTKIYFLMDISGSMSEEMFGQSLKQIESDQEPNRRRDLAVSAFNAIAEVIEECRDVWGTDIEYQNFMFADYCKEIPKKFTNQGVIGADLGGGTDLPHALKEVLEHIHKDDPANKRILVILTDGDVGDTESIKRMINQEAHDIRIVFVGITDNQSCDLIKHNIIHEDHGEAKIVEAMEEAL